jgi:hypothetical protein
MTPKVPKRAISCGARALLLLAAAWSAVSCDAKAEIIQVESQEAMCATTALLTVAGGGGEMTLVSVPAGFLPCEYPDSTVFVGVVHPRPNPYSGPQAKFCVSATSDLSIDMYHDDGSLIASFDFVRVPPGYYSVALSGFKSLGVFTLGLRAGDNGFDFREWHMVQN